MPGLYYTAIAAGCSRSAAFLMHPHPFKFATSLALAVLCFHPSTAHAVSCTVSAAMSSDIRASLDAIASTMGGEIARGDTASLQASAAPSLSADFAGVASVVDGVATALKGASITVESLYALHAADLGKTGEDAQFFCSRADSPLLTTVSLGQIPAGEYALAIVHATGVQNPQQFALILQRGTAAGAAPTWQLAGLLVRPLTLAGHSGLWFWKEARGFSKNGAPLSAYLFYQTAAELSRPADLITSGNSEKLDREMAAVRPKELADGAALSLPGPNGTAFSVTGLRIDTGLGSMDVRVDADVPALGDSVSSRNSALTLMAALLAKYPDLRANFHGLWVFEKAANGQTYAVEQPMAALP